VFNGKGRKDRDALIPGNVRASVERQIAHSRAIHESDLAEGFGLTSVPASLHKKCGPAMKDFGRQYLFPSSTRCVHPIAGYICRHHLHHSTYARQLTQAVRASGSTKRVTAHTFCHAFATELLRSESDIRTVQETLGTAILGRLKSTPTLLAIKELEQLGNLVVFRVLEKRPSAHLRQKAKDTRCCECSLLFAADRSRRPVKAAGRQGQGAVGL